MQRGLPKPVTLLLITLVILRVGAMVWTAGERWRGDFYASLPGAYVERTNPALWNSPDLAEAWGYHHPTYYHGPVQYLTLYPIAYLDSFAAIAATLLPIYAVLLALAFLLMWRVAARLGAPNTAFVPLLASTFLFFPLLQALLQREFEVVTMTMIAAALLMLVADRRGAAAATLAYVAWFKYIPLLFAAYFASRRWWRALLIFAAVSAGVLAVSEYLFGLELFFNNNVPGHARQVFVFTRPAFRFDATGHLYGTGFCEGWVEHESTLTNLRHGLCTLASTRRWLNPAAVYLAICAACAIAYLRAAARLDRSPLTEADEVRRRAIEVSLVTTVCACFFFSHYYYLILLIIPLNVLLALYWAGGRRISLALWLVAYVLIGAFVVPTGLVSRIAGINLWEFFVWNAFFLYGELLLVMLLLAEYGRLSRPVARA